MFKQTGQSVPHPELRLQPGALTELPVLQRLLVDLSPEDLEPEAVPRPCPHFHLSPRGALLGESLAGFRIQPDVTVSLG